MNHLVDMVGRADLIRHSRHVAAVARDGRVLAYGWAQYKSHPKMLQFQQENEKKIFLHAEIDAIRKTISLYGEATLQDTELFVVRQTKGGTISNSKPCEVCEAAIKQHGIKDVYWSE